MPSELQRNQLLRLNCRNCSVQTGLTGVVADRGAREYKRRPRLPDYHQYSTTVHVAYVNTEQNN